MKKKLVNIALSDVELSIDDSHEWRVKGYATRFGNVNCYGFKILSGAYSDVIASGIKPKMFFNHDSLAVPIGYWDKLEENAIGLKVEGVLTQGVSMAKDVYAALRAGTVDGLSVSISFTDEDCDFDDKGVMSLSRIIALDEISIVTSPADSKARVTQMLSADDIDERIEQIQSVRDLENFFKDTIQLSKRQSGWLTSKAKAVIALDTGRDDQPEANELAAIFDRIKNGVSNL